MTMEIVFIYNRKRFSSLIVTHNPNMTTGRKLILKKVHAN